MCGVVVALRIMVAAFSVWIRLYYAGISGCQQVLVVVGRY